MKARPTSSGILMLPPCGLSVRPGNPLDPNHAPSIRRRPGLSLAPLLQPPLADPVRELVRDIERPGDFGHGHALLEELPHLRRLGLPARGPRNRRLLERLESQPEGVAAVVVL